MRLKQSPKQMLVPTYDIDLVWHAHMAHPQVWEHTHLWSAVDPTLPSPLSCYGPL